VDKKGGIAVYILLCSDNTYYTGATNNIEKRVKLHNQGKGAKYTRGRSPVRLVFMEETESLKAAFKREREIKKLTRAKKTALIENYKPRVIL